MARTTNITCDGCGKVLYGMSKGEFVKLPNVQINGQIVIQKTDPETGYGYPVFVTRTSNERMNFCDLVCLQDHMEFREARFEEERKKRLREEASAEAIDRSLKGLD